MTKDPLILVAILGIVAMGHLILHFLLPSSGTSGVDGPTGIGTGDSCDSSSDGGGGDCGGGGGSD